MPLQPQQSAFILNAAAVAGEDAAAADDAVAGDDDADGVFVVGHADGAAGFCIADGACDILI